MTGAAWQITAFTLAVALVATLLMLPIGVWLAWLLARRRFPGRALVETLVSLPLVMPPVATGLILLKILGRRGPIGSLLARSGLDVVFTWKAVVIAMMVMGLPLLVRTARTGFEQVSTEAVTAGTTEPSMSSSAALSRAAAAEPPSVSGNEAPGARKTVVLRPPLSDASCAAVSYRSTPAHLYRALPVPKSFGWLSTRLLTAAAPPARS